LTGAAGLVFAAYFHFLHDFAAAELAALSLAAIGIWGVLGPFWAMASDFLDGTAAAAGIALINSVGNLGGFAGPYLVGFIRDRTQRFSDGLLVLALMLILCSAATWALPAENRKFTPI
jgi:MFS transporter, ACS family, tartrate transporter